MLDALGFIAFVWQIFLLVLIMNTILSDPFITQQARFAGSLMSLATIISLIFTGVHLF